MMIIHHYHEESKRRKIFQDHQRGDQDLCQERVFPGKVSDIAREAQVADGTIYLYFDNKDDILISLFEEQMKVVLENMIEQISLEKDALKKIEKFALTHLKLIELNKTWLKSSRSSSARAESS